MADERIPGLPDLVGDETTWSFIMDKTGETSAAKVPFIKGMQSIQSQITSNATNISTLSTDKADKTNVLELDNTTAFTPDADYEPATKVYADNVNGLLLYSARIYETAENITNTTNKTVWKNNLISSVSTVARTFNFTLAVPEVEAIFLGKYFIQVTSNPNTSTSTRSPGITFITSGGNITGFYLNLRDSSSNAQLDPFWIEIKQMTA